MGFDECFRIHIREGESPLDAINKHEELLDVSKSSLLYKDINDYSRSPVFVMAKNICKRSSNYTIDRDDYSISVFDNQGLFKTKYVRVIN